MWLVWKCAHRKSFTIDGVNIVALVSTNKAKLDETSLKIPTAKVFSNHHDMFNDSSLSLDAIVLSVPPAMHKDIELMATSLGIHMYIEKPIDVSLEHAKKIQDLVKKSKVITSVGYQGLCNPLINDIKNSLKNEAVGLVVGKWIGDFPQVHWWRNKELSGGQIVEQTTHIFSALYYLFGDVKSIYAQGLQGINDYENSTVHDYSSCVLTFKNGVIATIMSGCYVKNEGVHDIGFTIHTANKIINYDWAGKLNIQSQNGVTAKTSTENDHLNCMQLFIKAIQNDDRNLILSDYDHGVKILEITIAANKSIELGEVVYIN